MGKGHGKASNEAYMSLPLFYVLPSFLQALKLFFGSLFVQEFGILIRCFSMMELQLEEVDSASSLEFCSL